LGEKTAENRRIGRVGNRSGQKAGRQRLCLDYAGSSPSKLQRRPQPYLLSMYTEPAFRGCGLAKKIVLESLRWVKKKGFPRMTLHASEMGKNIYAKLGFKPTNEMKLDFSRRRR
jgi:GNAT superfamily N-acetyltransferase